MGSRELSGVSSYKDSNPIGLGPSLVTSFYHDYLLKALTPNTVILSSKASTYEWGVGGSWSQFSAQQLLIFSCVQVAFLNNLTFTLSGTFFRKYFK